MAIQVKHFLWMIEWALEKTHSEIKETQLEIMRNNEFRTWNFVPHGVSGTTENRERKGRYLAELMELHTWMSNLRTRAIERDAEEFAESMKDYFQAKKKK